MSNRSQDELIEYINLKNKLEQLNKNPVLEKKTKNPFDELVFPETVNHKGKRIFLISYKFWFVLLIILSFSVSILFNRFISTKIDPVIYGLMKNPVSQINKPYVVTLGNFKNYQIAKNKAVELLPKLRQINIKQLPTGNYTFEIDSFPSKEKAYSIAEDFKQDGLEPVNVRYLPNQ